MVKYNYVTTRTPLRISFLGGGTDMEYFYSRYGSNIFSAAINKFVYVTVKKHSAFFKENYRLNYSHSEIRQNENSIKNNIIRECLKLTNAKPPIYISTVADVPTGSGLGGSSSFTVGLLNALFTFLGKKIEKKKIYNLACKIEIKILKQSIGKQDQFPATYGGINFFKIKKNGEVKKSKKKINYLNKFKNKIKIYWSETSRNASKILEFQKKNFSKNNIYLQEINNISKEFNKKYSASKNFNLISLGNYINKSWNLKTKISKKINKDILNLINFSIQNGAYGAKLCGAGGGGFVLILADKKVFKKIDKKFKKISSEKVNIENEGTKVIYKLKNNS